MPLMAFSTIDTTMTVSGLNFLPLSRSQVDNGRIALTSSPLSTISDSLWEVCLLPGPFCGLYPLWMGGLISTLVCKNGFSVIGIILPQPIKVLLTIGRLSLTQFFAVCSAIGRFVLT